MMKNRHVQFATLMLMSVISLAQAQTYEILYQFQAGADGQYPSGALVSSPGAAILYGTTSGGGNISGRCVGGCGTIFQLDANHGKTILHAFSGKDGNAPLGGLVRDGQGNLYGITGEGGDLTCNHGAGCGVVYKLRPDGSEKVLHRFTGGADGAFPHDGLRRDSQGNLYGMTGTGGDLTCNNGNGCGLLFKVDAAGQFSVLHAFGGTPDGSNPFGRLIQDGSGNLYGTTGSGGDLTCNPTLGCGTVFRSDASGNLTTLYTFHGTDGAFPVGALTRDSDGNLYGITNGGGDASCDSGCGVVFRVDPAGNETVLYQFTETSGRYPRGGLIRDHKGNLYGTTQFGPGQSIFGTVFKLKSLPGDMWSLRTLHKFGFRNDLDGGQPVSELLRDRDGNIYGTAEVFGEFGSGIVFKITP